MTLQWVLLGLVVLLIAANALFVAVEFSLITVDRATVERDAGSGDDRGARGVLHGLKTLSAQLSGAQLGITVTSLVVGFIAEPSISALLQAAFGWAGRDPAVTAGVSLALAFVLATFAQMVFGELVPKNWAIAEPYRVARLVVGPQRVFMVLFGWLVRALNAAANAVVTRLGIEPTDELASARTAEELAVVVRRSGQEGTLDAPTAELLARSIEFGDRTADEVMVPRPRVTFLRPDDTAADLLAASARTGHSRFPVEGRDVDDVVGVAHFKDALAVPADQRASVLVGEVMRAAHAVPESMTLDPLLRELRQPGLQFAVVVDEYGGTAGIVTLEDLIEEIVGDILDEHDRGQRVSRRMRDGWLLSGLLRPDEVGQTIGLEIPEGRDSETLAGLVTERLDRLPQVGDTVTIGVGDPSTLDENGLPARAGLEVTVRTLDGRRVAAVSARVVAAPADEEAGS